MKQRACRSRAAAWATLALGGLAPSCMLRPGPDPTRFYVLTASASDHPPASGSLGVGLGPITMPGYLQTPMLATRLNATQVRYADVDRWAEPLPTLFVRALGQDLSALLGARIVPYPWYRTTTLDVVVGVDVTSFETDAAGNASLDACWSIRDSPTRGLCRDECSSIVEAVDDRGAQAQVAALSRAVGELARRVASAIRSCQRTSGRSGGATAPVPRAPGGGAIPDGPPVLVCRSSEEPSGPCVGGPSYTVQARWLVILALRDGGSSPRCAPHLTIGAQAAKGGAERSAMAKLRAIVGRLEVASNL